MDPDIDMIFTGELSHHAALTATEKGMIVVTGGLLFHILLDMNLRWFGSQHFILIPNADI